MSNQLTMTEPDKNKGEIEMAFDRLANAVNANDEATSHLIIAIDPVLEQVDNRGDAGTDPLGPDVAPLARHLNDLAARLEAVNYNVWNAKSRVQL